MPISRYHGGSGSTGTLVAEQIRLICMRYRDLPDSGQTSAAWMDYWDNRNSNFAKEDQVVLQYIISNNEPNTEDGWYSLRRRMELSTLNTSSRALYYGGGFGLPTTLWSDFSTRIPGILPDGAGDSLQGKRLWSLITASTKYLRDNPMELACAWAGTLSSALGTSA